LPAPVIDEELPLTVIPGTIFERFRVIIEVIWKVLIRDNYGQIIIITVNEANSLIDEYIGLSVLKTIS